MAPRSLRCRQGVAAAQFELGDGGLSPQTESTVTGKRCWNGAGAADSTPGAATAAGGRGRGREQRRRRRQRQRAAVGLNRGGRPDPTSSSLSPPPSRPQGSPSPSPAESRPRSRALPTRWSDPRARSRPTWRKGTAGPVEIGSTTGGSPMPRPERSTPTSGCWPGRERSTSGAPDRPSTSSTRCAPRRGGCRIRGGERPPHERGPDDPAPDAVAAPALPRRPPPRGGRPRRPLPPLPRADLPPRRPRDHRPSVRSASPPARSLPTTPCQLPWLTHSATASAPRDGPSARHPIAILQPLRSGP